MNTFFGEDAAGRASLAKKMANVMAQVKRVHKGGYNQHHKYSFASASDVLDMVRALMAAEGLALVQAPKSVKWERVETQRGYSTVCRAWFDMVMICADTGAHLIVPWLGEAQDSMDKGYNKAATAAQKYFLLKTFQMSTGDEEDPDAQHEQPAPKAEPATAEQLATMRSIVEEMGGEWEKFCEFVAESTQGLAPESLDSRSADGWIQYLKKKAAERAAPTESDTERAKRRAKEAAAKKAAAESGPMREPGEEG